MNTKTQRADFTIKAKEIISQLTLEEKVYLMSGNIIDIATASREELNRIIALSTQEETHYNVSPYPAGGIEKENIPPVLFCDGPRGVVCGVGKSTCFPVSMARGATFDSELEEEIGHCIGKEVRAFGGNLFAGVCVNLPYNPGWGRSQETYGEDTFHLGQMGAALVKGVQDEDIIACVKHFAFNQMENARFKCSVTCDQRTEKEVFLPHFKDCIDAGAASVMSSYNRYNGVMCGHHHYLLTEVLKRDWDFDGFVMSDFLFGVKDTVEAANGGQDMEMCAAHYFSGKLIKAVQDGFVAEERIDDAAVRIVRTVLAFNEQHKEYGPEVIGCKKHISLAKKAAEESITLLKNDDVLPLKKKDVHTIALIGKLAKEPNIGDYGSSRVRPPYVVTIEAGLKKSNPEAEMIYVDGSDIKAAEKAAKSADAVIFVAGYNHDDEGEFISENQNENYIGSKGGDRKQGLGLHEDEKNLILSVGPLNKNSTVVLIGGNMIMMTDWIDSVNAVIMAYYPGMEGGTAVAEILYGEVNPSGKLPFVIPYFESDLPQVDWEAEDQYYEYYHGYRRLEKNGKKPLIPYGFGLSYTTFSLSEAYISMEQEMLKCSVLVENTGTCRGDQVIQMYVGFENPSLDCPVKQLKGFKRIHLEAGEKTRVEIGCPIKKLKIYNPVLRSWILPDHMMKVWIGTSSDEQDLILMNICYDSQPMGMHIVANTYL